MSVNRALGTLNPVIYFENASGYVILPPEEIGKPGIARMVYEQRYKGEGWEWREAGTLADVDRLQSRLVGQEMSVQRSHADRENLNRDRVYEITGASLRQRMTSSTCTPFERDFIDAYLRMREDRRGVYQQRWTEAQMYLWAREQDSGTKIEDRMLGENSL